MSEAAREQLILQELRKGNVPRHLRTLKPVRLSIRDSRGRTHTATAWVLPDYLAIGSDIDYVRIPMNPMTAQQVADAYGATLPTVKLVDDINRQASVKLSPSPMSVRGARMKSSDAYLRHNQLIERQRRNRPATALTSGHKKDVVITNRLIYRPRQVAIYGWHRSNGKAIQPLSLVHDNKYADYSHGIRLVSRTVEVDGVQKPFDEVLSDRSLASLASYEGPMRTTRIKTDGSRVYPRSARIAAKKPFRSTPKRGVTSWKKKTSTPKKKWAKATPKPKKTYRSAPKKWAKPASKSSKWAKRR